MKKTIIALRGEPDSGKSKTIKMVYEEMSGKTCDTVDVNALDYTTDDGVKVGFTSVGDEDPRLSKQLEKLVACQVILCACRTIKRRSDKKPWSSTEEAVKEMESRDYDVKWVTKEKVSVIEAEQRAANREMANSLKSQVKKAIALAK